MVGDVESSGIRKPAGDVCWQLQEDSRGRMLCALHDQKDHSHMRVCREWSGGVEHVHQHLSWYDVKNREIINLMIAPSTIEQVQTVQTFLQRGVIPSDALKWIDHYLEGSTKNLITCLRLYLVHHNILPEDIFMFLGIDRFIAALNGEEKYELFLACFSEYDDPVHRKFCELYAPGLQKYYSVEQTT